MADPVPGLPGPGLGAPPPPPSPVPGLPPGAGAPRVGGVAQPLPNLGNQVAAMADVANALKMLQDALPKLPMGSKLHTTIFKIIPELIKVVDEAKPDQASQMQSLVNATRAQASGGPLAALSRIAPPGNAPPAIAPPGPGAAAPMAA